MRSMDEPILSVAFFRTDAGNEPVRAFLLDIKTALVRLRKL
jgi:hypothetical protein